MKRSLFTRKSAIAVLFSALASVFTFCGTSHATVAIDFTGTTVDWNDGNDYSLGWSFAPTQDIAVSALGVYAAPDFVTGERTFTAAHDVGIYNSIGQLIASTTVDNNDALEGFFRYGDLSSLAYLNAGETYYIAAAVGADQYTWDPEGFSVSSLIAYGKSYYIESSSLAFPTMNDDDEGYTTIGYFGPNMKVSPVPIPGAIWLLGSCLPALGILRRRIRC